jgi:hypothetical protein
MAPLRDSMRFEVLSTPPSVRSSSLPQVWARRVWIFIPGAMLCVTGTCPGDQWTRAERGTGTSIQRSRGASERRASYRLGRSRYCPRECERGSMDQDVRTCGPVSAARACTVLDIRYGQRHHKGTPVCAYARAGARGGRMAFAYSTTCSLPACSRATAAGRPSLRTRKK